MAQDAVDLLAELPGDELNERAVEAPDQLKDVALGVDVEAIVFGRFFGKAESLQAVIEIVEAVEDWKGLFGRGVRGRDTRR
jgi:hypothetical protein